MAKPEFDVALNRAHSLGFDIVRSATSYKVVLEGESFFGANGIFTGTKSETAHFVHGMWEYAMHKINQEAKEARKQD